MPSLLTTALVIAAAMVLLWLVATALRDVSIVDVFWGLGFVMVAHWTRATAGGVPTRAWLVTLLVTAWGVRLGAYLLWRNWGGGEDYRYQAMRRHYGERFWLLSLVVVFGLQGVLMWVISLPVQLAVGSPGPTTLGPLDLVGAVFGPAFKDLG